MLLFTFENTFKLLGPLFKVFVNLLNQLIFIEHFLCAQNDGSANFHLQSLYPNILALIIREFIYLHVSLSKQKETVLSAMLCLSYTKWVIYSVPWALVHVILFNLFPSWPLIIHISSHISVESTFCLLSVITAHKDQLKSFLKNAESISQSSWTTLE